VSFALDLGTHVNVRQRAERQPAKIVKVVNGTLQVHYFQSEQRTYELSNQTDKRKVIYIEYPIRDGWKLTEGTPKPDGTTQRFYRFRVELGPSEDKTFTVGVGQPLMDQYQVSSLSHAQIDLFVSLKYIDASAKAKLEEIMNLRQKIADVDQKLGSFNTELRAIEADQKRFRENIEALSKTPEAKTLIERYIAKAGEQETRLEEMEKQRKALEQQKEQLEDQLATEIRKFEMKDQALM